MKQHFAMMASYNRWANQRVYEAAAELDQGEYDRDMGAFFGSLNGTLNHVLVADRIWMKRFTGEGDAPATLDTILFPEFDALKTAREAEDDRIVDFIDRLPDDVEKRRFTFVTVTDMRTISQRLSPALSHFFNHQTHHRGQAHAILTALGRPSVPLDMIYFQRTDAGRQFA